MLGVNNVCLCSPHPHAVSISTSSRPLLMLLHLLTPHFILVGEPEKQGTGPSEKKKKKSQETRRNCNCVSPCCTNTVSPRTFHTEKKKSPTRLGRLHLSRHTVHSRAALHRTAPHRRTLDLEPSIACGSAHHRQGREEARTGRDRGRTQQPASTAHRREGGLGPLLTPFFWFPPSFTEDAPPI